LHNQTDEGVLKILRALIPALKHKPKIPVVINETILPERGAMGRAEEHDLRQMDLLMLVVLGAKQRTEKEFRTLVKEADPRFEVGAGLLILMPFESATNVQRPRWSTYITRASLDCWRSISTTQKKR
jgi:hypothetical protein